MRICVLGLGYIGLPTACLFANANHKVVGVDLNQELVEKLNKKELPFEEKGLADLFARAMPNHTLRMVKGMLEDVSNPVITVLGVAYNGGVEDIRETPALKLIKLAENEGYSVKVHDPYVSDFEYAILGLEEAVRDSDCVVIITDHLEFKDIDPREISSLMRSKNVVDTRNIIDLEAWQKAGFNVKVLGMAVYDVSAQKPMDF
jgi:UDP-N-acetyl-D-mannosaminuronate dehydrogenase